MHRDHMLLVVALGREFEPHEMIGDASAREPRAEGLEVLALRRERVLIENPVADHGGRGRGGEGCF